AATCLVDALFAGLLTITKGFATGARWKFCLCARLIVITTHSSTINKPQRNLVVVVIFMGSVVLRADCGVTVTRAHQRLYCIELCLLTVVYRVLFVELLFLSFDQGLLLFDGIEHGSYDRIVVHEPVALLVFCHCFGNYFFDRLRTEADVVAFGPEAQRIVRLVLIDQRLQSHYRGEAGSEASFEVL